MLRFLHLSDIHFARSVGAPELDVNRLVREDLLNDLRGLVGAGHAPMDAVLVVGDLAGRGADAEYDEAREFLATVTDIVGCDPTAVACVPGNHDVQRTRQGPLHDGLRSLLRTGPASGVANQVERMFASEEAAATLHAPFEGYNKFALPYGFEVTAAKPVPAPWELDLDGVPLRIRGVNSALISDGSDSADEDTKRLALGICQLGGLVEDARDDAISILLCHHTRSWLRDSDFVAPWLSRAHVLLTGHEHAAGVIPHPDGHSLEIAAGAVNPVLGDDEWVPAYNVLSLAVEDEQLRVEVIARAYGTGPGTRAGFRRAPTQSAGPTVYLLPLQRSDQTPVEEPAPWVSEAPEPAAAPSPEPPRTTDERAAVFAVLSAPVEKRVRVGQEMGLLHPGEVLDTPEEEQALLRKARASNRLFELQERISSE